MCTATKRYNIWKFRLRSRRQFRWEMWGAFLSASAEILKLDIIKNQYLWWALFRIKGLMEKVRSIWLVLDYKLEKNKCFWEASTIKRGIQCIVNQWQAKPMIKIKMIDSCINI